MYSQAGRLIYCPEELGFFIQKLVLDKVEVIYTDMRSVWQRPVLWICREQTCSLLVCLWRRELLTSCIYSFGILWIWNCISTITTGAELYSSWKYKVDSFYVVVFFFLVQTVKRINHIHKTKQLNFYKILRRKLILNAVILPSKTCKTLAYIEERG